MSVGERASIPEVAVVGNRADTADFRRRKPLPRTPGGSVLADRLVVFFCACVIFVGISFEHMPAALIQALPVVSGVAVIAVVRRDEFVRVQLSIGFLALLAWMVSTYFWSVDPSDTFFQIRIVVPTIVFGFVIGQLTSPQQLLRGLKVVVYPTLVVTVASLILLPSRRVSSQTDDVVGWRGPMSHKNGLGAFLVLVTVCMVLSQHRRWVQIVVGITVVVLIFGSDSRTALVVATLIVIVRLFSARWRRETTSVGRAAVVGSMVAWSIAAFVVVTFGSGLILSQLGREGNLSGRDSIWEAAQPFVMKRPVQGYGLGALWTTREQPTTQINETAGNGTLQYGSSHNAVLEVLLELGAVGFVLGLGLLLRTLIRSARLGLTADDPVSLLPFMFVVALSITSFTEAVFPAQFRFLGLLVGMTLPNATWRRR